METLRNQKKSSIISADLKSDFQGGFMHVRDISWTMLTFCSDLLGFFSKQSHVHFHELAFLCWKIIFADHPFVLK